MRSKFNQSLSNTTLQTTPEIREKIAEIFNTLRLRSFTHENTYHALIGALKDHLTKNDSSKAELFIGALTILLKTKKPHATFSEFYERPGFRSSDIYISEFGFVSAPPTPLNCFGKLKNIFELQNAKKNIPFLTFFFETFLEEMNKLSDIDKQILFPIISDDRNISQALIYFLSQLPVERLKAISTGDTLVAQLIDKKYFFKAKSDTRHLIDQLIEWQSAEFSECTKSMRDHLSFEIRRLRKKTSLNDIDIELSNLFAMLRNALKQDNSSLPQENKALYEAELKKLNIDNNTTFEDSYELILKPIETIAKTHTIDTESKQLLLKLSTVKLWYLTEYKKNNSSIDTKETTPEPKKSDLTQAMDNQPVIATQTAEEKPPVVRANSLVRPICESRQLFFQQPTMRTEKMGAYSVPDDISLFLNAQVRVPTHKILPQTEEEAAQMTKNSNVPALNERIIIG